MDKTGFVRYSVFEAFDEIEAFTTTKNTLSKSAVRFTGDEESVFRDNRKKLAAKLNLDVSQLVFPRQEHTDAVCSVARLPEVEIAATDALVSSQKNLCLCVQTADCVPILLFDAKTKVIAAIHAGWRGTVKNIVGKTIQRMQREFSCSTENIYAAIGPAISPEIYEVGDEVVQQVRKVIPDAARVLIPGKNAKFHVDLWEANRLLLLEAGLIPGNIEVQGECTFQNPTKYYSARREGIDTGRIVSGIMLK